MPTRKKTAPKKTAERKAPKPSPKARKPSQLDRIEAELKRNASDHGGMWGELTIISAKLDTIIASLPQPTVEQVAAQPEGLQPGDYTDASKETADALTAMGWGWFEGDHRVRKQIMLAYNMKMAHVSGISGDGSNTHLTPAEFLSRAAVTAKELGLVPVEPWVPKVGDAVRYKDDTGITKMGHGVVTKLHKGAMTERISASVNFESTHNYFWIEDLRPATDAEIAAHLAEQEAKKPVEFGTRVRLRDREHEVWKVGCDEPTDDGYYRLCPSKAGNLNTMTAKRNEFTVIDPQP